MAVNTSARCVPPLHRSMPPRLPPSFFGQTSSGLFFPGNLRFPRLTSVCSHLSGSDGLVSGRSVSLEESDSAIGSSGSPSSSSAIDFLTLCHRLKTTKRKGWINHGIKGPESIADHMYRMALIAEDIPGVNRERCIKIAIVHDTAEALVGDITPSDGVPRVGSVE